MKIVTILGMAAVVGLSDYASAGTVTINDLAGTTQVVDSIISLENTSDLNGMSVRVDFLGGGSEVVYMDASGNATGTGWSLNVSNDNTYNAIWTLASTGASIISFGFDAFTAGSVFDTYSSDFLHYGTASSQEGRDFTFTAANPFDVLITYSGYVAESGFSPVGDLFRYMSVDFAATFGSGNAISFMQDTDGFNASTVVPVPAAAWLFGSGLIGLAGVARRK